VRLVTPGSHLDVQQRMTRITPEHFQVKTLKYDWTSYY